MFTFFVKEMRQLCRDRFAVGVLILLCAVGFLLLAIGDASGQDMFNVFFSLGIGAAALVALSMVVRWSRELGDDSLNPFRTTPLVPWRVVAGKLLAVFCAELVLMLVSLLFAALYRYAVFPENFLAERFPATLMLLLSFSALLLAAGSTRFVTGLAGNPLMVLVGCVVLLQFLPGIFIGAMMGGRSANMLFMALQQFLAVGSAAFAVTVAQLMPPRSDRALPVRLVLIPAFLLWVLFDWLPRGGADGLKSAFCSSGVWFAALLLGVAAAERRRQSRRVAEAVRRVPPILRPVRILFSSGALPGIAFSLFWFAAVLIVSGLERGRGFSGRAVWESLPEHHGYIQLMFHVAVTLLLCGVIERAHRRSNPLLILFGVGFFCNLPGICGAGSGDAITFLGFSHDFDSPWSIAALFAVSAVLLVPAAVGFLRSLQADGGRA